MSHLTATAPSPKCWPRDDHAPARRNPLHHAVVAQRRVRVLALTTTAAVAQELSPPRQAGPGKNHDSRLRPDGTSTVTRQRLYQLIRQAHAQGEDIFAIEFTDPGVQAYGFGERS